MRQVRAIANFTGPDFTGKDVLWTSGEVNLVRDRELSWFMDHTDLCVVLDEINPPLCYAKGASLSAICAAATFTSLTYEDNAGNVRLVSAGVHGLTTDPAVGQKIYVNWTGTAYDGFYTILAVDTTKKITIDMPYVITIYGTPVAALVGDTLTLATITLPAGTMGATGKAVIDVLASHTSSANDKTLGITFGGTAVVTHVATTTASTEIRKTVYNTAEDAQLFSPVANINGGSGTALLTDTIDTAAAVPITLTAIMETANEIVSFPQYRVAVEQ